MNGHSALMGPPAPEIAVPARSSHSQLKAVVIEDRASIPGWVIDLATFRTWAWSDEFPHEGRFSFLQGDIWADLSMEEFLTHNQVKVAISLTLLPLIDEKDLGRFIADRMLLTNELANLSTEPDGMFSFWETLKSGRLKMIERNDKGIWELSGAPDMVLEIVSKTSVRKDTEVLRGLYFKVAIPEYWLIDVRTQDVRFEILRLGSSEYVPAPNDDGWLRSDMFNRSFRLIHETDPLGKPRYRLLAR
jgi:Uma2 family endonuclease